MRRTIICWAFLWLWVGVASDVTVEHAWGRTVTDMIGRQVKVPDRAKRLVTTFKPAALCVTALGLQGHLVGIDTDSQRDRLQLAVNPSIAHLPAVGQKSAGLNFEVILSVNPDLVIMFAQKDGIAIADRFVAHGVAAIVISPETLPSLYDTLRLIAGAAGQPQRAERVVAACQRLVNLARQGTTSVARKDRQKIYFASPLGVFTTASGDMLQDQIIRMAGGINAGHELTGYFREISPEQFIAWNPDIVVMSGPNGRRGHDILGQPQFAGVNAVATGRIYDFPSNIAPWDFPSPLSALGVLWLAKTFYPQPFAHVDLNAEVEQFHRQLFGKSFTELGGRLPGN